MDSVEILYKYDRCGFLEIDNYLFSIENTYSGSMYASQFIVF